MRYCKANLNCPVDLLVWTSRSYLSSIVGGFPTRSQLLEEIVSYGGEVLLDPLQRIWDVILASSHDRITLHQLDCPCLSIHEQSLIIALRSLQRADRAGAITALAAVLPPSAVRTLTPDMQVLADALTSLANPKVKPIDPARRASARPELRVVH